MPDVFTKARRSAVMSRIRGAGNKDTELRLIALMRAAGITGWRRGARLRFLAKRKAAREKGMEARGRRMDDRGRVSESGGRTTKVGRQKEERRRGQARSSTRHSSLDARHFITIRPDFVFPMHRVAVFVDGCFFHGCSRHMTWPKHNAGFWRTKILGNQARDRMQTRLLRKHGWRVLRIWEHALGSRAARHALTRLRGVLVSAEDRG